MRNILFIILGVFIFGLGTLNASDEKVKVDKIDKVNKADKKDVNKSFGKVAVVYFSATGNTKKVAVNLAKASESDIYEIKPATPYTKKDLDWQDKNSRSSKETNDKKARPKIVVDKFSPEGYDAIFLGFPIWWGSAPRIMYTFLEKYDFSNKKIIIFATSNVSELGNTAKDLKEVLPKSTKIVEGGVLNSNPTVADLKKWVKSLK